MSLSASETKFIETVKASLRGESVQWESVSRGELETILSLASTQKMLPLVYEAIYSAQTAGDEPDIMAKCRRDSLSLVFTQTLKTEEFLKLYSRLRESGLSPLAVKGILCRDLYELSDHRISADEDLFVTDAEFLPCCEVLRSFGMLPANDSDENGDDTVEIGWHKADSPLYIELHRRLFPSDSPVFDDFNACFNGAFDCCAEYTLASGETVLSLDADDHLLYLILHAYKHFIYKGFGIRQVCDIGLWAKRYSGQLDSDRLTSRLKQAHAQKFAAAVFEIAESCLGISLPDLPIRQGVDFEPMLSDILDGGIYGGTDLTRVHSATATVNAVEASRKQGGYSFFSSVFPTFSKMKQIYPRLEGKPYLLPAAWISRIFGYAAELVSSRGKSSAAGVIATAKERTELLRYYEII